MKNNSLLKKILISALIAGGLIAVAIIAQSNQKTVCDKGNIDCMDKL